MDRRQSKKKHQREKNNSNRSWTTYQKTYPFYGNKKIQEKIKNAQRMPMKSSDILVCLKKQKNFLGVFASDQIRHLKLVNFPCFIIVNLDTSRHLGRHWVSLRFGKDSVELFDSLGGSPKMWTFYPSQFLNFLRNYAYSHTFISSPVIQPPLSVTCGLYCIFFVIFRQKLNFFALVRMFSSNFRQNDLKLFRIMKNKFRY